MDNHFANLPATGIDLAVRAGSLEDSSLVARHQFDSPLRLVASPDYLAKVGEPTEPRSLESLESVITSVEPGPVTWTFSRKGVTTRVHPRGRLRVNDLRRVVEAVQQDLGIGLLPELLVRDRIARDALTTLLPGWAAPVIPVHLLYSSRRLLTLTQQTFVAFVCDRNPSSKEWRSHCPVSSHS